MKKLMTFAASLVLSAAAAPAVAQSVPAAPSGFTLTWADDFEAPVGTGLDTADWTYSTGCCFGVGQVATMTTSTDNVYHDG